MGTTVKSEWEQAIQRAANYGFCTYGEVGENIFAGNPKKGITWGIIAEEMACSLPGLVFVSKHGGLSHVNGKGGSKAAFVPAGQWLDMQPGREAIRALLGSVNGLRMATPGKAAALLLRYAADPETDSQGSLLLTKDITWGYHDCKPGLYKHLTQWDCSGYYYSILDYAKSLRVYPRSNGLEWGELRETEKECWNNVKAAIKDCKILRNSLVGVMGGSTSGYLAYARTKNGSRSIFIPGKIGPFRNLACLVVRTGWEMCRVESLQCNSVYSTIDCVTTENHTPSVWERFGLYPTIRRTGEGDIKGRGIYRIGLYQTLRYREKWPETTPMPVPPSPNHWFTTDWLHMKGGLF